MAMPEVVARVTTYVAHLHVGPCGLRNRWRARHLLLLDERGDRARAHGWCGWRQVRNAAIGALGQSAWRTQTVPFCHATPIQSLSNRAVAVSSIGIGPSTSPSGAAQATIITGPLVGDGAIVAVGGAPVAAGAVGTWVAAVRLLAAGGTTLARPSLARRGRTAVPTPPGSVPSGSTATSISRADLGRASPAIWPRIRPARSRVGWRPSTSSSFR